MKYVFLPLLLVYLPLVVLYVYQRKNKHYDGFTWGAKNRIGVWLAIAFALLILTAKPWFPSFAESINLGWKTGRGGKGGEVEYFLGWLFCLTLLIFPHIVKKDNWSVNPTGLEYADRFNANGYWYVGLLLSLFKIYRTWQLLGL